MRFLVLGSLLLAAVLAAPHEVQRRSIGSRIIGGSAANGGQFPFATALHITKPTGNFFCTGALITTKWILTAAQCVDEATAIRAVMGQPNLKVEHDRSTTMTTSTYIIHPDYNSATLAHDVAVILLPDEIAWTFYHKALQGFRVITDGEKYTTVGWGQLDDDSEALSDELHHADLFTIANEECKVSYYGSQLLDNMVCARGKANEGTCAGDSGSPLIYDQYGIIYQVGIASFLSANGCASTDPSGYTRVAPYHEWISNVTNSHHRN